MKIIAIGFKKEGEPYETVNPNLFQKQLDELPPGKYQQVVEKYKNVATPSQFGYLYTIVYPLSMIALNNAGYEFTHVDQIDSFWKNMFAVKPLLNRETGEIMKLPMSKSEFTTVDEVAYTDAIRNYCSEYLSTNIPDADPHWRHKKK